MTATKAKPKPKPANESQSFIAGIAADHEENIREADQLLRELVIANRAANYKEMIYFRERGWDESRVKSERRRMHNVIRDEAIAGDLATRKASQVEAKKSGEVLASEGPKLDAQIDALQKQRDALERDARLAKKRVTDQTEAVVRLRELAPEHVRESANEQRRLVKSSLGKTLGEKKIRLNELDCCLDPGKYGDDVKKYLEQVKRSVPGAVIERNIHGRRELQFSADWMDIEKHLREEKRELEPEIAKLESELSAALQAIEESLDYYAGT
ncbi:hypothetical protein [Novipirellula artificiosorum]|uniref:Uncharacterized protein n=1 Tax=Novipirellula artificiosorum TaxID=2528016 RepID=A0A5C6DIJ5_9BACT|nr:hypothetical protein [Novipirellula artificiosorum]TWU36025.1 hypothetical protein Poly41_37780 [Novipirellula artificiosorum]